METIRLGGNHAGPVGPCSLQILSPVKTRLASDSQTPADLLNDLRNLLMEAEKIFESSVSEHTGEAIDALRTRYEAVEERLGEVYASAKKNISAGAQHTDEAIRANPYQSMAIAVGVGLLIGVLIGRRSSK
jgi:ElaB/YqjD/DUF883 family membrane-anchored ribosome-binding protein